LKSTSSSLRRQAKVKASTRSNRTKSSLRSLYPLPTESKWRCTKFAKKEALDWPLAFAAVALSLNGDAVRSARVVLGHVAPVPWPSPEAEQALVGKTFVNELADEAGKAAVSKATPLSKNAYKVQLARVAVKRALLRAVKGEA